MWLSGRAMCQQRKKVEGSIPREHTYWKKYGKKRLLNVYYVFCYTMEINGVQNNTEIHCRSKYIILCSTEESLTDLE